MVRSLLNGAYIRLQTLYKNLSSQSNKAKDPLLQKLCLDFSDHLKEYSSRLPIPTQCDCLKPSTQPTSTPFNIFYNIIYSIKGGRHEFVLLIFLFIRSTNHLCSLAHA
ncbi:hypothetical protein V6Z11_A08G071700 [Gossypium hirsutum]